jgi:hypothetical protein
MSATILNHKESQCRGQKPGSDNSESRSKPIHLPTMGLGRKELDIGTYFMNKMAMYV